MNTALRDVIELLREAGRALSSARRIIGLCEARLPQARRVRRTRATCCQSVAASGGLRPLWPILPYESAADDQGRRMPNW